MAEQIEASGPSGPDGMPHDGIPHDSKRQAELYWRQIIQLKGGAVCVRLYRNRMARRVRAVDSIKAIASSGAIAGWVIFHDAPFLWACIITAAQVLDAIKNVFPFAKLHRQAADLTVALELLLIDAEDEWENIHIGSSRRRRSSTGGHG